MALQDLSTLKETSKWATGSMMKLTMSVDHMVSMLNIAAMRRSHSMSKGFTSETKKVGIVLSESKISTKTLELMSSLNLLLAKSLETCLVDVAAVPQSKIKRSKPTWLFSLFRDPKTKTWSECIYL